MITVRKKAIFSFGVNRLTPKWTNVSWRKVERMPCTRSRELLKIPMALPCRSIRLFALFDGIYSFGCFFLAGKAKKSPAWLSEKIKKLPTQFAMNAKEYHQYREVEASVSTINKPEDSIPLLNLGSNRVNMNVVD